MKVEGKTTLLMALFVGAVFMLLASKFMRPTGIQVIVEGQSAYVRVIPIVYTAIDCVIIAISSFLLGASAFYLFITYSVMPEKARAEHKVEPGGTGSESALPVRDADTQVPETSKTGDDRTGLLKILKGNEKKVIEVLMEYGEMNQADLSARTGIPKSTLSRILQDLEDRSLIFRYDYGMSKMVKLGSGL